MQIGTIKGIWRYPVKSLGGERVPAAVQPGLPGGADLPPAVMKHAEQNHAQSFGASQIGDPVDESPYTVGFRDSGRDVRWTGRQDRRLGLAESNGIAVSSGCRYGACQACADLELAL